MKKPLLTVFLIAITVSGLALFAGGNVVNATSKTITVPDDYSQIQDAVDNADAGDTVFVRNGIYRTYATDGISVNKSIALIGESSQNTTLTRYPVEYARFAHITVNIQADNVTISGFTITGSSIGIFLNSSNCKIRGNNISNNIGWGVYTYGKNQVISENNITNDDVGISQESSDSIISNNNITKNGYSGVIVGSCENVTFAQNNIVGNGELYASNRNDTGGLKLRWAGPFYVYENNITDNVGFGVDFAENCSNSMIYNNNIVRNQIGVNLRSYSDEYLVGEVNKVYYNNIVDNGKNVDVQNGNTDVVAWDNGYVGNYWSHYQTKYPNASEIGNSGVWDTPYEIDANNTDHYPLMSQVDVTAPAPTPTPVPTLGSSPSVPEFPSTITLIPLLLATILSFAFTKRKKRTRTC